MPEDRFDITAEEDPGGIGLLDSVMYGTVALLSILALGGLTFIGMLFFARGLDVDQKIRLASGAVTGAGSLLLVVVTVLLVRRTRELSDATGVLADSARATERLQRTVQRANEPSFLIGDHRVMEFQPDYLRVHAWLYNRGLRGGSVGWVYLTDEDRPESGQRVKASTIRRVGGQHESDRFIRAGDAGLFDIEFRNPSGDWREADRWVLRLRAFGGDEPGKWVTFEVSGEEWV